MKFSKALLKLANSINDKIFTYKEDYEQYIKHDYIGKHSYLYEYKNKPEDVAPDFINRTISPSVYTNDTPVMAMLNTVAALKKPLNDASIERIKQQEHKYIELIKNQPFNTICDYLSIYNEQLKTIVEDHSDAGKQQNIYHSAKYDKNAFHAKVIMDLVFIEDSEAQKERLNTLFDYFELNKIITIIPIRSNEDMKNETNQLPYAFARKLKEIGKKKGFKMNINTTIAKHSTRKNTGDETSSSIRNKEIERLLNKHEYKGDLSNINEDSQILICDDVYSSGNSLVPLLAKLVNETKVKNIKVSVLAVADQYKQEEELKVSDKEINDFLKSVGIKKSKLDKPILNILNCLTYQELIRIEKIMKLDIQILGKKESQDTIKDKTKPIELLYKLFNLNDNKK